MSRRDDIRYRAMVARDPRYDGKFFVGVKTTGIYCRPICPARPKRRNVEFFEDALAAERAGYRPCLRCRPESAPFSPAWMGKSALVRRALRLIADDRLSAERVGVSARHLRRLFHEELGLTPKQVALAFRLNRARKLLLETDLPVTEVAFASGFRSLRRFNDAVKQRFRRSPTELRRNHSAALLPVVGRGLRNPGRRKTMTYFSRKMHSPIGELTLVATAEGLAAVLWEKETDGRVPLPVPVPVDSHPVLDEAERQLGEYFAGRRRRFDLPLAPRGTPFQLRVWKALAEIPYGVTVSYGELARRVGSPRACRAVGAANGRNPLSIVIPCHRVVGHDGRLTGFAGGLSVKARLLEREGISGKL